MSDDSRAAGAAAVTVVLWASAFIAIRSADRHPLVAGTHAATSVETAAKTDVMARLLPVKGTWSFRAFSTAGKVKGRHRIPVIHLLEIRKLTPDCTSPEPDHRRSP